MRAKPPQQQPGWQTDALIGSRSLPCLPQMLRRIHLRRCVKCHELLYPQNQTPLIIKAWVIMVLANLTASAKHYGRIGELWGRDGSTYSCPRHPGRPCSRSRRTQSRRAVTENMDRNNSVTVATGWVTADDEGLFIVSETFASSKLKVSIIKGRV